jgi:hypothetical protein
LDAFSRLVLSGSGSLSSSSELMGSATLIFFVGWSTAALLACLRGLRRESSAIMMHESDPGQDDRTIQKTTRLESRRDLPLRASMIF